MGVSFVLFSAREQIKAQQANSREQACRKKGIPGLMCSFLTRNSPFVCEPPQVATAHFPLAGKRRRLSSDLLRPRMA